MLEDLTADADTAERDWIAEVLRAKAAAPESALIALSAVRRLSLMAEIAAALEARASIGGAQKAPREVLDAVLRDAVLTS